MRPRLQWLLQHAAGGPRRIPGARLLEVRGGGAPGGRCQLGLSADCLRSLLAGQTPMIVCRGALDPEACQRAAARLEAACGPRAQGPSQASGAREALGRPSASTRFEEWRLGLDPSAPASDYAKLGYTKTDVLREEGVRMAAGKRAPERYLQRAAETARLLEADVFAPGRSPLQDVSEELDSLSGVACRQERCPETGRLFLPCVIRRMVPGGRPVEGNVHMDTVKPGRTVSLNMYFSVPDAGSPGGEVVLWPLQKGAISRAVNSHFFSTVEVQNFYPGRTFYTDELLASGRAGAPLTCTPAAGDVVLLDPAYPHCVRDFAAAEGTRRISLQTFAQVSWVGPWYRRTLLLEYAV